MALSKLTNSQKSHIMQLSRHARSLYLDGSDLRGWPVITRTDVRGTKQYAIKPDGKGVNAMEPITQMTAEDAYDLDGYTFAFLSGHNLLPHEVY